jgi:hypothetical protein
MVVRKVQGDAFLVAMEKGFQGNDHGDRVLREFKLIFLVL